MALFAVCFVLMCLLSYFRDRPRKKKLNKKEITMVAELTETKMNAKTEQELTTPNTIQRAEKAVTETSINFGTAIITSKALSSKALSGEIRSRKSPPGKPRGFSLSGGLPCAP